jgi:hypothetical protein
MRPCSWQVLRIPAGQAIPTDASVEDIWPTAPENSILSVQRPIDVMSVYVVASGTQPRTRLGT